MPFVASKLFPTAGFSFDLSALSALPAIQVIHEVSQDPLTHLARSRSAMAGPDPAQHRRGLGRSVSGAVSTKSHPPWGMFSFFFGFEHVFLTFWWRRGTRGCYTWSRWFNVLSMWSHLYKLQCAYISSAPCRPALIHRTRTITNYYPQPHKNLEEISVGRASAICQLLQQG